MEVPQLSTDSGWTLLVPEGRIDAHTAPDLDRVLSSRVADGARVAVDLTGVTYVSSAGLRSFLSALKALSRCGGRFALLAPGAGVRDVLEVSGFSMIIPILASPADLS